MKSKDEKNSMFTEILDDELEEVTGGIDWLQEKSNKKQVWYGIENEKGGPEKTAPWELEKLSLEQVNLKVKNADQYKIEYGVNDINDIGDVSH